MKFDDICNEILNEGPFRKAVATGALAAGLLAGGVNASPTNPNPTVPTQASIAKPQEQARTQISNRFLDELSMMESSHNPKAIGDNGAALGLFQLHKGAWEQVESVIPYTKANAFNPQINRKVAYKYLLWLEKTISRNIGRPASVEQIYSAWNAGYGTLRSVKYDASKMSLPVRNRANRLAQKLNQ